MKTEHMISSVEQMILLGQELVQNGVKKFGLVGELGAGKTHFSKGVALGLGLDPALVHSPTYVYFHEYNDSLLHVDMYRMEDKMILAKSGLDEKLEEYEYWCIEWPKLDRFDNADRKDMVLVSIEIIDNQTRKVTIK